MIYFIQAEGTDYVKIGYYKNNFNKRVSNLQVSCPFKLKILLTIEGTHAQEQQLHKRYASQCIRGEWFLLTPDMLSAHTDMTPGEDLNPEVVFQEHVTNLIQEFIFPTKEAIQSKYPGYTDLFIKRHRKLIKDLTIKYYGCALEKVFNTLIEVQELSKTLSPAAVRRRIRRSPASMYSLRKYHGLLLSLPPDFFKPHTHPSHKCRNSNGRKGKHRPATVPLT